MPIFLKKVAEDRSILKIIKNIQKRLWILTRDSRKSWQKLAKNTTNFCENGKNHGIKLRAQKTIIKSIKPNI